MPTTRCSLFVLLVCVSVGCSKTPMLKRIDVPRQANQPADNAPRAQFDIGRAGSATNLWAVQGNFAVAGEQALIRFDGTAWKPVEVPAPFKDAALVPSFDVEALPSGNDALLLTNRQSGGVVAGLLTAAGVFTDLSSQLVGTDTASRPQSGLFKKGGQVYARIVDKIFKYENSMFTRLSSAEELTFADPILDDAFDRVVVGTTVWRLKSGTLYSAIPGDESPVAKLEVSRSVGGAAPERVILKATKDDLIGSSQFVNGTAMRSAVESYDVLGLVRGAGDTVWLSLIYSHAEQHLTHLIFRKVVGDVITTEERFGLDLDACSTSTLQPECGAPIFVGGSWASNSPMTFVSGGPQPNISAVLVQVLELR